jgi:hypothetical protein
MTTTRSGSHTATLMAAYAERADRYHRDTAHTTAGVACWSTRCHCDRATPCSTWGAGPACASRCCWTASAPSGMIIGLDPAPEMLALAQAKVDAHGWTGVHLIRSSAEEADIPGLADAALLSAVHDVLQSPTALKTYSGTCAPGRRWPPRAASGRRRGSCRGRCTFDRCTRNSSATSPASSSRGGCSNDGSTGSASPRWHSDPATSRQAGCPPPTDPPGRVVGPERHGPRPLNLSFRAARPWSRYRAERRTAHGTRQDTWAPGPTRRPTMTVTAGGPAAGSGDGCNTGG